MANTQRQQEVMTPAEVAEYLQLAERTVLRMAQRGEIPATKVASQWRFLRPAVREWLESRMQTMPRSELQRVAESTRPALRLVEVIRPELTRPDISPGPKEDVLSRLVEPLRTTGFARDPQRLLDALLQREEMMTTAVGHGVALPHPRRVLTDMFAEPAVAMGICPAGTDFDAVDAEPVHLLFLICATCEREHLQLMAKVSWLTRREDIRRQLRDASSQQDAQDVIARATEEIEPADANHSDREEPQ
ncbi:MAG: PTS sugar transporter subunit IIA [Phycisphaerae bacterium]